MKSKKSLSTIKIAIAGMMAALCFAGYALIPTPELGDTGTKIHLGNTFVVLAALLLGPWLGGLSGAIGLSLADLYKGYYTSMPRTFISKFMIGIIVGVVAYKCFKINRNSNPKKTTAATVTSALAGLGFNCFFEPALKYVWYKILFINMAKAQDAVNTLLGITTVTTLINTVLNSIIAITLYLAIRPALVKSGIIVIERDEPAKTEEAQN